jgi:tetratricopeptide (TPR) repeat protein
MKAMLISIFFFVLAAAAPAAHAEPSYEACTGLVETDPDAALDMAQTLKLMRGDDEAGGMHCEALALTAQGRPADAAPVFYQLAERMLQASDEMRAPVYAQAGDAWALAGNVAQARRAYSQAIARMPEDPGYRLGRARMRALEENWEGARDDAAEALALDPYLTEAMLLRAAANRVLGFPQAALADANKAVELRPHDLEALVERGRVHMALGNRQSAWTDWQSVLDYAAATGRNDDPAVVAARQYLSR